MPKTTKRTATKRAARIAKAHATELSELKVKAPPQRVPGGKRPARGLARYPWAVVLTLLLIGTGVYLIYFYHVGPFALPKKPTVNAKATATVLARATATATASSPCSASSVVKQITDTAAAPTSAAFDKIKHTFSKAPAMTINTKQVYCVGLNTSRGLIVLELDPKLAPTTVNNFVYLAQHQFYDGMKFYRVVPNSLIQTGDAKSDVNGSTGYTLKDENTNSTYNEGCVAMYKGTTQTSGGQFFVCTANDTKLDKKYNLFGHVVTGMDIAKKIQGPGDGSTNQNVAPDTLNHVTVLAVNPS